MKRQTLFATALCLLAAGFVAIFAIVLDMRFSDGDVYPYYASFRNDPLGTSALYESLSRLEQLEVRQNVEPLTRIRDLDGSETLFLLGLPRGSFEELRARDDSPVLEAVKKKGTRLVITMHPILVPEIFDRSKTEEEKRWIDRRQELREKKIREQRQEKSEDKEAEEDEIAGDGEKSKSGDEKKSEKEEETEEEKELAAQIDEALGKPLFKTLDIEIADVESFERPEEGWETSAGKSISPGGTPESLPFWHSQFRFKEPGSPWKAVVLVDDKPVVVERKWGKGSVVLATDSYFASNEALHLGAETDFLLWLIGGQDRLIFDETIHGSTETGGAMKLIRRYRLQGFLLGMMVFVALWAWRSATSLAPGDEELDRGLVGGTAVAGEQNESGLIRLLRRSVPTRKIVQQCVEIFRESKQVHLTSDQSMKIGQLIERNQSAPRDFPPAEAYRNISEIVHKR